MRVALVIPAVEDFYFTPQRASFLGVYTLADILARNGIEYAVFNGVRSGGKNIPLPAELEYLGPYVGREYFFKAYRRYGITADNLAARVREYRPDCVLVSCFAFCYALSAIEVINAIRETCPHTVIVAGGAGVTVYPEYFIRRSGADFVARGEVDGALVPFLHSLESCGPFIARNDLSRSGGGDSTRTEEGFVPVMVRTGSTADTEYFSTMLTRGCPMRCSFCSVRLSFPRYRQSSREHIRGLFNGLRGMSKKIHVNFEDDNLLYDRDFLFESLDELNAATGGNYRFSMENGAEYRLLDTEMIRKLKEYRLKRLNLPLVSSNPQVLDRAGRPDDVDSFVRTVEVCVHEDIPVTAYLIAGLPGESTQSIHATLDFLERMPVLTAVSVYYKVPGVAGCEDMTVFDEMSPRLCAGTSLYPWNSCSTDELFDIFTRSRKMALARH